jgi:molybdopterin molybdotransferase
MRARAGAGGVRTAEHCRPENRVTPYPQALQTILSMVPPLPPERVQLEVADGRALAADAVAQSALPARDNSAMDGYAVRSGDLSRASANSPVALQVASRITAGDAAEVPVEPGQAARIMTGGAMPAGADAVVMQEDVERRGDQALFSEPVEPGEHVRRAGDDIRGGEIAVAAGVELGASELALLAALGHTQLSVHRRPRVALISTGDEIAEFGHGSPGKLVDSNALALGIRLRAMGAEVVQLGVAPDDPQAIRARFEAARGADVVVS